MTQTRRVTITYNAHSESEAGIFEAILEHYAFLAAGDSAHVFDLAFSSEPVPDPSEPLVEPG